MHCWNFRTVRFKSTYNILNTPMPPKDNPFPDIHINFNFDCFWSEIGTINKNVVRLVIWQNDIICTSNSEHMLRHESTFFMSINWTCIFGLYNCITPMKVIEWYITVGSHWSVWMLGLFGSKKASKSSSYSWNGLRISSLDLCYLRWEPHWIGAAQPTTIS